MGAGVVPRRVAALNAAAVPAPMSAQPPRLALPHPQAQPATSATPPPLEDKLPLLLGRLNKPDADWDKWGINELTRWCRESVRSRPHQSSIAILLLSHENGALLDLVSESFNGASLQSDAALRLRKGRVDIGCAWGWSLRRGKRCARAAFPLLPPPLPARPAHALLAPLTPLPAAPRPRRCSCPDAGAPRAARSSRSRGRH